MHAYETWGFTGLSNELIDILNIWANFIYGPMLEDRVRTIADQVSPGMYGRQRGLQGASGLAGEGAGQGAARIRVHGPRGDRARRRVPASRTPSSTIHRLFNDTIAGADLADVAVRQREAFAEAGVPLPD